MEPECKDIFRILNAEKSISFSNLCHAVRFEF